MTALPEANGLDECQYMMKETMAQAVMMDDQGNCHVFTGGEFDSTTMLTDNADTVVLYKECADCKCCHFITH